MSYDLVFWRQTRMLKASPAAIDTSLVAGNRVRGLKKLPLTAILAALGSEFETFDSTTGHGKSESGSFDVAWSEYHFSFMTYGGVEHIARIVVLMRVYQCPLFDPQQNVRYDLKGVELAASPFDEPRDLIVVSLLMPKAVTPAEVTQRIMDPLAKALSLRNYGGVGGKGTLRLPGTNEDLIGVDVLLTNLDDALCFAKEVLKQLHVPRGSVLQYFTDSGDVTVPVYDRP